MKKLNQIFIDWKPNTIFTNTYFEKNNIYPQLLNKYIQSGWLERIGNGAYIKKNDLIDYFGGLHSIQEQLKLQIYVGGKSALSFHGFAHYINQNIPYVEIYGSNKSRLPKWFLEYNWNTEIIYSTTSLFGDSDLGITKILLNSVQVSVSTPERAILELLNNLPKKVSFDETYKIMEGLYNLRADLLNELLVLCTSIKVKRLFLFLSEKIGHFWFDDLEVNKFDLGIGKREIIKNGILDKKYMITIPRDLQDEL